MQGMEQQTTLQTAAEIMLIELKRLRLKIDDMEKKLLLEIRTMARELVTLEDKLEATLRGDDGC